MKLEFQAGLWPDWTGVSDPPRYKTGYNIRFMFGRPVTMGILRALKDVGGTQIGVDVNLYGRPNMIAVCSRGSGAQVLIGQLNKLYVAEPSVDSTLITGTRWTLTDIAGGADGDQRRHRAGPGAHGGQQGVVACGPG